MPNLQLPVVTSERTFRCDRLHVVLTTGSCAMRYKRASRDLRLSRARLNPGLRAPGGQLSTTVCATCPVGEAFLKQAKS